MSVRNGKYGDYFSPGDCETLSKKILQHFNNPKKLKKKSEKSLNHINKFSLKKNIDDFNKLFLTI